jgi:hypothetical protein
MVDYFTKIAEFAVVEDHTSAASAAAAYSHWISRYPRPRKWTTDCGTENQGHFHALMERLNIQHVTTAVFNPTANGACERLVGTLKRMIKKLIRDNSTAWPFVIPQARAAYMRRVHSATGFSPIQLLTGFDDPIPLPLGDLLPDLPHSAFSGARISLTALHHRTASDTATPLDRSFTAQQPEFDPAILDALDASLQIGQRIQSLFTVANYNSGMARERQRLYAAAYSNISARQKQHRARFLELQRRRSPSLRYEFQRGDYVLISNQKAAGLTPTYMGPFLLVNLSDNGTATVQSDDTSSRPAQRWTVRRERLVPYRFTYRCFDDTTHDASDDSSPTSSSSSPTSASL